MSHIRPRGHIRHANRAAGFPNFGFDFPPFGSHESSSSVPGNSISSSLPVSSSVGPASSSISPSSTPTPSSTVAPPSSSTTSTTTSPIPVSTTYTGSALHNNLTKIVTQTNIATAKQAVASSSSSSVPAPTNALVAPVLGGVAGGIVGLALLIFLITFCIRRRRKDDEAINFDPGAFRRSAMLLSDPPTHQDTIARGFNPPAMVETHPTYMTQHNYDHSPGATPNSSNPLVFEAPFSPISPGTATTPIAPYDHAATGAPPALTRNLSAASSNSMHGPTQYAQYPALTNHGQTGQLAPQYVDMERTSVTPFQAAQYAEISKQLRTEVPKGLDTPAVEEFVNTMPMTPTKNAELPPIPQDPFSDDNEQEVTLPTVQNLSFPAPPSPVATSASRYRIDSMPPSLPEIIVQSRVSVGFSENGDASSVTGFPSGQTVLMKGADTPLSGRFPVTPSPLASSFTVATPPAAQTTFPARAATKARPDTVYDPEDAYGGI